ncbi:Uu.00g136510.m01.CDS01 [Anthostomella pinea]|uniref:Uu.00g136510.m01.CDS01 n=1 Tax=Anthostomella pinea TaxID=933095 RepID=A0AAI8YIL4_9PEZI|nr:Uu.00g136510.m01.CDS01 [Anthostomella pinea]
MDTKDQQLTKRLEQQRKVMLGASDRGGKCPNQGFWNEYELVQPEDPGAIRILVFGNTGTQVSNRARGQHDVSNEIRFENRPDLVVHDSGGFEAESSEETQAIEDFLKTKSAPQLEIGDRLHVIWFCLDLNAPRAMQASTITLFKSVSKRRQLKHKNKTLTDEECDQYAEVQFPELMDLIEEEMLRVEGGRLDACIGVSAGETMEEDALGYDQASIE